MSTPPCLDKALSPMQIKDTTIEDGGKRRPRREVEEEGKRVGGFEGDASHAMFGGKH